MSEMVERAATREPPDEPLSPSEFAIAMRRVAKLARGDPEIAHDEADRLLCRQLVALGFREGVAIFDDMAKWYA